MFLFIEEVMSRLFTLLGGDSGETGGDSERVIRAVMNKDVNTLRASYNSMYLASVRDSPGGNNLLHLAVLKNDYAMVKFLLDCKVDKNYLNRFDKSPSDYAIREGNKEIIKLFFEGDLVKLSVEFAEEKRVLKTEVIILKANNKRLMDENSVLGGRVLVLTREKEELGVVNKKLKTSNDAMMAALRK